MYLLYKVFPWYMQNNVENNNSHTPFLSGIHAISTRYRLPSYDILR